MNNNNYSASTNWQYSSSSQRQDTVNNSTSGEQPYVLSVSANTTTQLTGQIFVNGVVVRQIKKQNFN